jgi:hypothetical protein
MTRVLVALLVVAVLAFGVQQWASYTERIKSLESSLEAMRAARPVSELVPFELAKADGQKVTLQDCRSKQIVFLYFYDEAHRDASLETAVRDAARDHTADVMALAVRSSVKPEPAKAPQPGAAQAAEPQAHLTPPHGAIPFQAVTDEGGRLAAEHRVASLPEVVVLKSRPIRHATLAPGTTGGSVEAMVSQVLAGDDLKTEMLHCGGDGCAGPGGMGACGGGPSSCGGH